MSLLVLVANWATNIWVFHEIMHLGAPSLHRNFLRPQERFNDICAQHQIWAGIIGLDLRHRAIFTQFNLPLTFLIGRKRPTFLNISTPKVISIKEFTFAAERSFHNGLIQLDACKVIASACVHSDDIAFFDKGRALNLETSFTFDQVGYPGRCVSSCSWCGISNQKVY